MRIGIFSDTYHPTINGITYVADSLKREFEGLGHEVYIFCPARSMRPSKYAELLVEDHHIRRIPSFSSGFFEDFDFAVFFPPRILRQIKEMELDVIHVLTPSQIGLLGMNAAIRHDTPFVVQHCTDLYQYSAMYPNVLPGVLALLSIVFPLSVKIDLRDWKAIIKAHRPRLRRVKWVQEAIASGLTMLYSKADAVIALSRKSYEQLRSWQDRDYRYEITLMPNGVNSIPKPSAKKQHAFNEQWGIRDKDEIFGFVGRLAEEKNLDLLIKAMDRVGSVRPNAKLLFVGDFEYRPQLEKVAAESLFPERIIFTGAMPRDELGVAYSAMDVFCFPSLTDTQGWVLHEAAHAGLPIVVCDKKVSEVVHDRQNGYFAHNRPGDYAKKVIDLLRSPVKREKFGVKSKQFANLYTTKKQIKKLEDLYRRIIDQHHPRKPSLIKRIAQKIIAD